MSNKLVLTQEALTKATSVKAMLELEPLRDNWVRNYQLTTGKENGSIAWEREKVLFMQKISTDKKFEQCDRITIYSSLIELAASGLTLQDDLAYIIPYGKVAQFQPGWKGRLKQISELPHVAYVNEPILVYESDDFDYEVFDGKIKILKHKPNRKRPAGDLVTHVYAAIDTYEQGVKIFLMTIEDVYAIRDKYSTPYKNYVAEIAAKGLKIGDSFKKTIAPRGQNPFDITVEPPFWVTSPEQAIKKTLVKRVYGSVPKTSRMKALDERIKANHDIEDATNGEEIQDIDYGIDNSGAPATDAKATEVKIVSTPAAKPKREVKQEPEKVDEQTGEVNPVDGLPDLNDDNEY